MKVFLSTLFVLIGFSSCSNYGKLKKIATLPDILEEASGIEKTADSEILWMHNDSGNEAVVFGLNAKGEIIKTLELDVKNRDWEDITSDELGNLYIADFGNNDSKRRNLVIYLVEKSHLEFGGQIPVKEIKFSYANQKKFPPKKKDRFFDAESILYFKGSLYIFTKSRVKEAYGRTTLYKIPAVEGDHIAQPIGQFETSGLDHGCWITGASISPDQTRVALINHHTVFVFSNFKGDSFLTGDVVAYELGHASQKEAITFKNNTTIYITDERSNGVGGNLYEFHLEK